MLFSPDAVSKLAPELAWRPPAGKKSSPSSFLPEKLALRPGSCGGVSRTHRPPGVSRAPLWARKAAHCRRCRQAGAPVGSRRGGGQSGEPAVGTRGAATAAPLPVCPVLPRELWAVWSPCRSVPARSLLRHAASAGTRVSHGQPPEQDPAGPGSRVPGSSPQRCEAAYRRGSGGEPAASRAQRRPSLRQGAAPVSPRCSPHRRLSYVTP